MFSIKLQSGSALNINQVLKSEGVAFRTFAPLEKLDVLEYLK